MSTTLVTCWWDLESRGENKRRDFGNLGKFVLNLPYPIIIFCDPWIVDELWKYRKDNIVFISMPFEQTKIVQNYMKKIESCTLPLNRNRPKDTHTFIAMGWNKPWLMAEAARFNPFNTTHIGWIDLGISHAIPDNKLQIDIFDRVEENVNFHVLRCVGNFPANNNYYDNIMCLIAAGYIIGNTKNIIDFEKDFEKEIENVLKGGKISIDEDLLASLVYKNPNKYTYSYGNYEDILTNHKEIKTNGKYLLWMLEDALSRNQPDFVKLLGLGMLKNGIEVKRVREILKGVKMNLLKLHMIVKDESERIKKTLESVKPFIDSWCILDTGSTDGTQEIIKEVFKDIPGKLYEEPVIVYDNTGFIDYAATRNRGLELAGTDSEFILLLNGDDSLENGEALRKFCEEHVDDEYAAYFFRITGETRGWYDSTRLMKPKYKWRYCNPTHEVLCGDSNIKVRVSGATIFHEQDPLEKRIARWKRDEYILSDWLKKHPGDHRTIFYLAQTYECLGQLDNALEFYLKRAELKGWAEEQYEAFRRAARCAERLGHNWSEIQQLYLDAHAVRPQRLEALYSITEHWIEQNPPNNALAYQFAEPSWNEPIPEDDIYFVNPDVYEFGLADIVTRSAYYLGKKDIGRLAAKKVVKNRGLKNDRRNYHFYSKKLKDIVDYKEISLQLELEPGWTACNPSICINENRQAIIRTVNYKIKPNGCYDYDGTIVTRNFWVDLDENYNITNSYELLDKTNRKVSNFPVKGFEDCRLFVHNNRFWISCTVRDMDDNGTCQIGLLTLDGNNIVDIDLQNAPNHQKNWKPIHAENGIFRWIYSTDPLVVVPENKEFDQVYVLLGSSQAIPIDDGWLWVDHEATNDSNGGGRMYVHRLVKANKELTKVEAMSDPFCFTNLGIEYCNGLAIDGKNLVFSFSVHDASANLAIVPLDQALGMLDIY